MKPVQWFTPLPVLAVVSIPLPAYAASCDTTGSKSTIIGTEFIAAAGPNASGEYRFDSIALACSSTGQVTWSTFPEATRIGWYHPLTVADKLVKDGYTFDQRLFVNACGTHLVGVNKRFTGTLDGHDMALSRYPLLAPPNVDVFDDTLLLEFSALGVICVPPPPPANPDLGAGTDCSPAMIDNEINAVTGNNYQHETDINDAGLNFERMYNSQAEGDGDMGSGWRHNYESRLHITPDSVTVTTTDGAVVPAVSEGPNWNIPALPGVRIEPMAATDQEPGTPHYRALQTDGSVQRYNAHGLWHSTTYPDGRTLLGSYNSDDRLSRVVDQFDNELQLNYQAGRLDSVTSPGGQTHRYQYNDDGMLATATAPDGSSRHYHYQDDQSGQALTQVTNGDDHVLSSWSYDDANRVTSSFDGPDQGQLSDNANNVALHYGSDATTVTNALGKQTTYHFISTPSGNRITELAGHATQSCAAANRSYSYTTSGQLHSRTDWLGNTTRYTYNDRGLQIQRIEAADTAEERVVTTAWHAQWNLPTTVEGDQQRTLYEYDAEGRLLEASREDMSSHQAESRSWSYQYDSTGRLIMIDGPRDDLIDQWQFQYDSLGRLVRWQNPLGHAMTVDDMNSAGLPTAITDGNGLTILLTYDDAGRLLRSESAGLITTYEYRSEGLLAGLTLPGMGRVGYGYDGAGRLVSITNSRGETLRYTLDTAGNRIGESLIDSVGAVHYQRSRQFDSLGRLHEVLDAAGASVMRYQRDAQGNPIELIEPLGARSVHLYDALNRVRSITHRDQGISELSYSNIGLLSQFTDARELSTRYEYDGLGNLRQQISPDTGTTILDYDAAGNMTQRTDARGVMTHYHYDALGRLGSIRHPGDPWLDTSFGYDDSSAGNHGIGQLTRIDDGTGSTRLHYNAQGRVSRKTVTAGNQSYTWSYSYHANGQLARIDSPSGLQVHYQQDPHGALSSLSYRSPAHSDPEILVDTISWYPFGTLKQWRYGNGITTHFNRDPDFRLEEIASTGDSQVLQRYYQFNALQDIEAIDDGLNPLASQTFAYDPEHRLEQAAGAYGTLHFSYDTVGNRLQRIQADTAGSPTHADNIQTYQYAAASNQLTSRQFDVSGSQQAEQYRYDESGNLIARGGGIFSYDDANRMSSYQDSQHMQAMSYNAFGQRVIVNSSTDTRHYHYDEQGRLIAESDGGNGEISREYIYAAGQLVTVIDHGSFDTDGDQLDDDWELTHFSGLEQNGSADSDGDGIIDRIEYQYGLNPMLADAGESGGNTIPDLWEQHYFGQPDIDPGGDHDGDGFSNLDEYRQLTDPTDSGDTPPIADWLIPILFSY